MSVDFDADPAPAPPAPAAPVDAAPEPPPVPEPAPDPDEVGAVEIQGGKHVPLEALKASRAEARTYKEQAARLPQLEQQIAQMQGSLATFQQLRQQYQPPPPQPTGPAPIDPDDVELARSLDYYLSDGTPDVGRAQKHAAIIERRAQKIAAQSIAPLQQQNARAQSAANYQAVRNMASPQGVKPSEEMLTWMWQNLPAEYTADPRVAQALPALAIGLDVLRGNGSRLPQQPAPPSAPPLHTESLAGGPARRASVISPAEREVIAARGMTEEKYTKLTANFQKGRPTQLDED